MNTFRSVFTNPIIINRIIRFLPVSPDNDYKLPATYFRRNACLRRLKHMELFIYCAFYFGYEKSLYLYHKDFILDILNSGNIIDIAAENNDFIIIKKIYLFCKLEKKCYDYYNTFSSGNSLFASIKHKNFQMFRFLHSRAGFNTMHISKRRFTRFTRIRSFNYNYQGCSSPLLIFASIIGELKILKYICYNLNPFICNDTKYVDTLVNHTIFEFSLEETIKYNHIICAYFLVDYYSMLLRSTSPLRISFAIKNRIRLKTKYIHDVMFNNFDHYSDQAIDWWYIRHNTAKLSISSANEFILYLENKENIDQHSIGIILLHYFCKLQKNLPHSYIHTSVDENSILTNIIDNICFKPLVVSKKITLDLYVDFYDLYNKLNAGYFV